MGFPAALYVLPHEIRPSTMYRGKKKKKKYIYRLVFYLAKIIRRVRDADRTSFVSLCDLGRKGASVPSLDSAPIRLGAVTHNLHMYV